MLGLEEPFAETWRKAGAGRSAWQWVPRALVVFWLAWVLVSSFGVVWPRTIFSAINLGIHEAGHLVFSPFGRWMMVAGGTILQLLAPLAAGVVFVRRGDLFAVSFAAAWLAVNLVEVSVYVGDARAQALPLVTIGGGDAMHDWAYLLGRAGLLRHDRAIAALLRGVAYVIHAAAIVAGAWLVTNMATRPPREEPFD